MSTQSSGEEVDLVDAPEITDTELEEADRQGKEMRNNIPWALAAKYEPAIKRILVPLSSGIELSLSVDSYEFLKNASDDQRSEIEICAGGYELFFSKLDDGVWLPNYLLRHADASRYLREHPEAA